MRSPFFRARVVGPSMVPTLRHGDVVLVRRVRGGFVPRQATLVVVELPDGTLAAKRFIRHTADGGLWVEGDNPFGSTDSRTFGALPPGALRGHVLVRLWPRPGHVRTSHQTTQR